MTVDWKSDEAVFDLTKATLLVNCRVKSYELPSHNLMPRIPQRLAYLQWIKHALLDDKANVTGFDIGVGANCIYPILGKTWFGW